MNIISEIKERLSIFKNMYDMIRVVDPINKKVKFIEGENLKHKDAVCYNIFKKNSFCKNCISMRAYQYNDTFTKVEYSTDGKVFLITATPVNFENKIYVAEIIKIISENNSISSQNSRGKADLENLITTINDKYVENRDKNVISKGKVKKGLLSSREADENKLQLYIKNIELSELKENINQIRDILNEVSCTSESDENDKEKLLISEYLDKLIVKYMKTVQKR